jgi:hypothetical protein
MIIENIYQYDNLYRLVHLLFSCLLELKVTQLEQNIKSTGKPFLSIFSFISLVIFTIIKYKGLQNVLILISDYQNMVTTLIYIHNIIYLCSILNKKGASLSKFAQVGASMIFILFFNSVSDVSVSVDREITSSAITFPDTLKLPIDSPLTNFSSHSIPTTFLVSGSFLRDVKVF